MLSDRHHPDFLRVHGLVTDSAMELFSDSGVDACPVAFDETAHRIGGHTLVAVIGYAGDTIKGSVVMMTTREVAVALQPADIRGSDTPNDDVLRDQMGELTNQLLGRLKNKLLAGGVCIQLATPTTAVGTEVRLGAQTCDSMWQTLVTEQGPVVVRFDAKFAPAFLLGEIREASAVGLMSEGDMMLF